MGALAGQQLRHELRREYAAQHRRIGWRYIPAVLAYCVGCSILIAWLAWTVGETAAWFGAGVGVGVSPLLLWVTLHTPEADRLESAAIAEEWVADQLDRLAPEGWTAHHGVSLVDRDIDHVAIGPGGVIVIETKWTNHDLVNPSPIGERIVRKYERQLESNVRATDRLLKQFSSDATTRRALIAVGGPGRPSAPARTKNGVFVVPIDGLSTFLSGLTHVTDLAERTAAHNAIEQFVSGRESYESARTSR